MIKFFTGMRFLDIFTCCIASLIVIAAVLGMAYIYIYERKNSNGSESTEA